MDFTSEDLRTSLQRALTSPEILDPTNPSHSLMTTSPVFQRRTVSVVSPPLREPEVIGPSVSSHQEESSPSLTEGHTDSHMANQPSQSIEGTSSTPGATGTIPPLDHPVTDKGVTGDQQQTRNLYQPKTKCPLDGSWTYIKSVNPHAD